MKVVANEFGVCPYCGSKNIKYDDTPNNDSDLFDETYLCEDCNKLFMQTFSRKQGWLGNDVVDEELEEWVSAEYILERS